ncbi:MAG: OsmC family peroxiredoxin [Chloroflexota bacterium]|nr:OsmC family peroxiredoxin [Chloroflexota bacterium]
MAVAERRANAVWEGNLNEGKGRVQVGSGALDEFPVTWASRTERSDGKTSPEELIAAAEAACFSMALSNDLAKQGNTAERISVAATCTLDRIEGKLTVTTMDLEVTGRVPGIDQEAFQAAAENTSRNCPVSRALVGNVDIRVQATLETS